MAENILTEFDGFFFLGLGGVSMSALAEILYKSGKKVGGYDREESEYTARLAGAGIPVWYGFDCRIDDYEVIVYTDALQENNPLIMRARRLNKTLISRGKLLYEISRTFKKTVAVAGCHGKTTCTAMLAHIFDAAGVFRAYRRQRQQI